MSHSHSVASFSPSQSLLNSTTNNDITDIDIDNDIDITDINDTMRTNSVFNTSFLMDPTESLINNTPNSIFELVKNVNYRKKSTTTSLLSINSTSTVISLNGPTSKDIPPTKLSSIQLIPNSDSDFINYLNLIDNNDNDENYYNNFKNSKLLTSHSLNKLNSDKNSNENENSNEVNNSILKEEKEANLTSNNLLNVPKIYFNEDFRLDDPRIFNKVIENTRFLTLIDNDLSNNNNDDDDSNNSNKLMVDHEALQDKLSSYLDIIEINLIHEIAKSSDNFFSALDDLKKITKSSKNLTNQLQNVNSKLLKIKLKKINNAKNLIKMIQKYQNIQKFNQILIQIKLILNQSDLAESFYYKSNYDQSLELVDSVFALIKGNIPSNPLIDKLIQNWKFPPKDLNKLPALIPLKRLLSNLITDTGKSYAKLFSNYLIDDLRLNYENISTYSILQRLLGNNDNSNNKLINNEFNLTIINYLKGLTRCGELSSAFKLYEERLSNELKSIFKSNLPTDSNNISLSSNKSDDSKSTNITTNINNALILSDLVKNMTPKEFENMLVDDYTKFSETFRRLIIHKNLLLTNSIDVLNNFDSQILKIQPDLIIELDISNSISYSINSIQRRMAKLIKIREQQNSFIPLNYFLRFYKLNISFLTECEIVSKGMINDPILKDVINRQLMIFIQQFHKESMKRCIKIIETEIWKDDGLSIESQLILDLITRASEGNVEDSEWIKGLSINFEDYNNENLNNNNNNNNNNNDLRNNNIINNEIRKTLNLHSQNYILPSSVGLILGTIKAYLLLIHYFKNNINNIISQNYLPELFKAINLKIHQSVLGAQATKTAGLKHITTKHLALACEVCRFWSVVVADIERACLSELNNFNNSKDNENINKIRFIIMKEFDEVRGLFGEQVVDVYDKLVAIMRDTTLSLIQNLKISDFLNSQNDSNNEFKVNLYMENIVKKTLTIARSVQRYLPIEEYNGVMMRIFNEYEKILSEKYKEILNQCLNNEDLIKIVKFQIKIDIEFFRLKLDDENSLNVVKNLFILIGYEDINESSKSISNLELVKPNEDSIIEKESKTDESIESKNDERSVESKTDETSVEESKPDQKSVEETKPDQSVEETKPVEKLVEKTKPDEKSVEESKPVEKSLEETKPDQKSVEETKPDQKSVEEESKPDQKSVEETKPDEKLVEETKPHEKSVEEETKPDQKSVEEESKPDQKSVEETKPDEKLVEETKPHEKSVEEETKPDQKSVEETKPDQSVEESKPVEDSVEETKYVAFVDEATAEDYKQMITTQEKTETKDTLNDDSKSEVLEPNELDKGNAVVSQGSQGSKNKNKSKNKKNKKRRG
ncbi:hypothetical protein C6P42_003740 [Pichia californica]|nr:hypothetical protein C6P42_003740 [[Candida] californica]